MTDKTLKRYLDRLNQNKTADEIFVRPLTNYVSLAKIWDGIPKPTDSIKFPDGPYTFYLIKDDNGFYVGIVLDMSSDLHWYILPLYRGHGHLTKALKETILPHLFQDEREAQTITIDANSIGLKNSTASEKVAMALGFKLITSKEGIGEFILKQQDFQSTKIIDGQNTEFTEEQMKKMKKKINFLSRSLWVIRTELEMKKGESELTEDLYETVAEIKQYICRVEDLYFDTKEAADSKS